MTEHVRSVRYTPIGVIHSPLKESAGAPIQSVSANHVKGIVEVFPSYARGLKDIAGFSHLILIYHFHMARKQVSLVVRPYLDSEGQHGVFSTRAPARPNSIGISTVRLERIKGRNIYVKDVDIVDGTPLLDIKPYVPRFDYRRAKRIGWYAGKIHRLDNTKADSRFAR
jgi:tRNA-Thr(GGU) m(6)t(6)A37 methyltransferase TsaA